MAGFAFSLATLRADIHNPGTSLIAAMAIFFKAPQRAPSFYRHLATAHFLGQERSVAPSLPELSGQRNARTHHESSRQGHSDAPATHSHWP